MANQDRFDDELRPEYGESDLHGGVRGKYAERYAAEPKTVQISAGVELVFRDDAAIRAAIGAIQDRDAGSSSTAALLASLASTCDESVGQYFLDVDRIDVN
ncbi:MAG: hypothetical protein DWQ42_02585 [Planctomycetota bacterium]|nr:MAG: hypothetical protein DWQ42_02585 [Planctomycetota bacterium]REK43466.1 MAG: hypothetical protein DWQ46_11185 [Planctomycetota bacterium]